LGHYEDLEDVCRKFEIDTIIVADAGIDPDRMVEILHKAQNLKVKLEFIPALHSLFVHQIHLSDVDGLPLIQVKNLNGSYLQRIFKKSFDFSFSLLLLIFSSPLFLFIAFWIKVDSKGPIFFRQKRVGQNGKEFWIYKFRSMRMNAESYAPTPGSAEDPRITRSGRWLRRFSLDELPQLFNVIKGEMSLVGPRPEMPFITRKYNAAQSERLRIKPGITGLWQISGDRRLQIHENLDYDLYYIEHQGFLLDIVILLRTFFSVIRGIGAW
jgi:exopolysaccharide biosynthesis polyprenyl glycosylphosphotransferase